MVRTQGRIRSPFSLLFSAHFSLLFYLSHAGMCCKFGRGKYVGSIGGARTFSSPDGGADWKRRTHQFEIDESKTDDEPKTNLPLDPKIGTGAMTSRDRDWLKSHNTRREKWYETYTHQTVFYLFICCYFHLNSLNSDTCHAHLC